MGIDSIYLSKCQGLGATADHRHTETASAQPGNHRHSHPRTRDCLQRSAATGHCAAALPHPSPHEDPKSAPRTGCSIYEHLRRVRPGFGLSLLCKAFLKQIPATLGAQPCPSQPSRPKQSRKERSLRGRASAIPGELGSTQATVRGNSSNLSLNPSRAPRNLRADWRGLWLCKASSEEQLLNMNEAPEFHAGLTHPADTIASETARCWRSGAPRRQSGTAPPASSRSQLLSFLQPQPTNC
ncbi:hypothetical protein P7K49_032548 [Saguinus oedipus]|uniref:Uncharacterized protein n=1 Tax=Saguinus oedipus TaxID=9490 RepID=A0ABQ9TYJ5_SAGOE|nr:hypothetical protein P7K49_032548 [Saguinus oedipus]